MSRDLSRDGGRAGKDQAWWVMGFTWLSSHEYSLMCCLGHGKPINCTNEAFEGLVLLVFAFPMVSRGFGEEHPYREEPAAWKCDLFSSCALLLCLVCPCLKSSPVD